MKELPNVETLSPPPTEAELAWWNGYRRRKRWRGIVTRFVVGVSVYGAAIRDRRVREALNAPPRE